MDKVLLQVYIHHNILCSFQSFSAPWNASTQIQFLIWKTNYILKSSTHLNFGQIHGKC